MSGVRESHERRISSPTQRQTYTMITDIAAITAAITEHLAYLDEQAIDCTATAKRSTPLRAARMIEAANVYDEVAAELRHTLGMDPT
jgi:hypothetical protein